MMHLRASLGQIPGNTLSGIVGTAVAVIVAVQMAWVSQISFRWTKTKAIVWQLVKAFNAYELVDGRSTCFAVPRKSGVTSLKSSKLFAKAARNNLSKTKSRAGRRRSQAGM